MIRVLIVDDDKLVRKGLISAMPWEEFHMQVVGEAGNGEKALEWLESHEADLLLTDLAMPVMSGIELMRIVRKRFPKLHIVVLTLHQDFEYIQEALRLGAIDYIAKVQLEKERFEEVLKRIHDRILQEADAGGTGRPAAVEPGVHTSDRGFAFLCLSVEAEDGWIRHAAPEWSGAVSEAGPGVWLWIPEEGKSAGEEGSARLPKLPAGWVPVELSGLRSLTGKEVYRRLKEFRERELFYEYDPERGAASLSIQEGERKPMSGEAEELTLLKQLWSSPNWIHQDAYFHNLVAELRQLRLPEAKLFGPLYALSDEWNRLFYPVSRARIGPPPSFTFWYEAEAWLHKVREEIRRASGRSNLSPEVAECVLKAVSIIREEAGTQVTVAEIARRVNMSRSYFSQIFKDMVGATFNDYLRQVRMEKAKEYLRYTGKTIQWIAEQTGYMDEKYFSRTFREMTGMLPSEYRQAVREGREMSGK
ncbi:response regulator [Paenibacillus sp. P26]|nr:response regulator [Paenibacillus sp. P26]UUZ96325.1 response regulator [Paenibacillus sp. P25]